MRTTRILALAAVGVLGGALAACGGDSADDTAAAGSAGGPITVKASDTTCEVAKNAVDAGTSVFTITNGGNKVTEFYVYAPGDRVMGEVENIAPGLSRELHVELPSGTYETACKPGMIGKGIRAALTVSGSAAPLTDDAKLADATASYSRYVKSQTGALLPKTEEFVAAVKAGDVDKAKALFPIARPYWERIEPVADHARLARGLVGAGLTELHDQLALQPRRDVLHLAHHPLALAVHVELGDLVAVVGDDERVGTGRAFIARQFARGVRRVDRDLRRRTLTGLGRSGLLLGLAAGQRQTRQRSRGNGEGRMKLHVVDLSGSGRG